MSIDVGKRVRRIRTNAGLNQREFASLLGISSGGISQIESGKAMPGGDFLLKIHQIFHVDLTWLLTGMSIQANPSAQLSSDKQALIDAYEEMSDDNKRAILQIGASLSQSKPNKNAS